MCASRWGVLLVLLLSGRALAEVSWNVSVDDSTGHYSQQVRDLLSQQALAAGEVWSRHMPRANASIEVQVQITDVGNDRANGRSATSAYTGSRDGYNVFESGASFEIRTGEDPNGYQPDVLIQLDSEYIDHLLWCDPNPHTRSASVPFSRVDATSVMIHEIGHAIAFNGWRDWSTGGLSNNYQSPFDRYVQLINGQPFFTGPAAEAAYGGPVPLTLGNLYHLGNSAPEFGAELTCDLMNGVVFSSGVRYDISALDLAVLEDYGTILPSSLIPEPASMLMLAIGIPLGVCSRRARRCGIISR